MRPEPPSGVGDFAGQILDVGVHFESIPLSIDAISDFVARTDNRPLEATCRESGDIRPLSFRFSA
jgi:hypothetical protein